MQQVLSCLGHERCNLVDVGLPVPVTEYAVVEKSNDLQTFCLRILEDGLQQP